MFVSSSVEQGLLSCFGKAQPLALSPDKCQICSARGRGFQPETCRKGRKTLKKVAKPVAGKSRKTKAFGGIFAFGRQGCQVFDFKVF
jgi:hypothetical protein